MTSGYDVGMTAQMAGHERLIRVLAAVAIVGGPLGYLVGGLFAPAIHISGSSTIVANLAAPTATNAVHLVAFVVASFLLPVGAAALAYLSYPQSPWLATVGGLLGVIGWLPFSALTALDDLANTMAHLPHHASYAQLLDQFTNDTMMNGYLIVYVVCHLVAYVLLAIALRRGRVIPAWAAWLMAASSPLTVAAFAFHDSARTAVGVGALALLLLGNLPAVRAIINPPRVVSRLERASGPLPATDSSGPVPHQ